MFITLIYPPDEKRSQANNLIQNKYLPRFEVEIRELYHHGTTTSQEASLLPRIGKTSADI